MSNLKVGDEVVVLSLEHTSENFGVNSKMLNIGESGVIETYAETVEIKGMTYDCRDLEIKKIESEYPKSNRKKLHDYIKSTGHTSVKLGELVGNKWYFSNITKKSRFDSRGDISKKTLIANIILAESAWVKLSNQKPEKQSTVSDESVSEARKEEVIRELDLMQGRTVIVNNYQEKQANWNKLNKIAFLICILFLISILTILYNIVSK